MFEQFVSYRYPEIVAQSLTLTSVNSDAADTLSIELDDLNRSVSNEVEHNDDPCVKKQKQRRFEVQAHSKNDKDITTLHILTKESGLHLITGLITDCRKKEFTLKTNKKSVRYEGTAQKGIPITFDIFTGYSQIFDD